MILFGLMLAIQVAMIVDVIRNGRNSLWIMALLFIPVASTIAYVIIEVLPRFRHHRHVRHARAEVSRRLDPEREVRSARAALDLADTIANRTRLADALTELGRHKEALPLYRSAIGRQPDFRSGERLARCLFVNDQPAEALAVLDGAPTPFGQHDRDRAALLRARMLEDLGRYDEALPIYAAVSERLSGDEARCRLAALLLKVGRERDARRVLQEVEQRMPHVDRQHRLENKAMYDWAVGELGRLRT